MTTSLKDRIQTEKRNYTRALEEAKEVAECIQDTIGFLDDVEEWVELGEVLSTFGNNGTGSIHIQLMQEAIDGEIDE